MNSFKRIILSVKSQIDTAADQFENHEALASAAIGDLKKAGANSSIQLRHVKQMLQDLERKHRDLNIEAEKWESRAILVAKSDKNKALDCMKRLKDARSRGNETERQIKKYQTVEIKISDDLQRIQHKIVELKHKKTLLSARQNQNSTRSVLSQANDLEVDQVTDIFERWEDTVVADEFQYQDVALDEDTLTSEFELQEQQLDLEMMLDELIQQDTEQSKQESTGESL